MSQKWRIPKKQPWRTHQKSQRSQKVLSSQLPECWGPCPFDRCKHITHCLRTFALDSTRVKGHPLIVTGGGAAATSLRMRLIATHACHTGTSAWLPPTCLLPAYPTSHAAATFAEVIPVVAPDPGCLSCCTPPPQLSWAKQDTKELLEASTASQSEEEKKIDALQGVRRSPNLTLC